MHIGWAKPLVNTISKFDAEVRAQVHIICCDQSDIPAEDSKITNTTEKDAANIDQKPEESVISSSKSTKESEAKDDTPTSSKESKKLDEKNAAEETKTEQKKVNLPTNSEVKCEMPLSEEMEAVVNSHPETTLYSHKMKGLKSLLLSEKLNTHAISLHLTAQSQVFINKKTRQGSDSQDQGLHCSTRPKRVRRE